MTEVSALKMYRHKPGYSAELGKQHDLNAKSESYFNLAINFDLCFITQAG